MISPAEHTRRSQSHAAPNAASTTRRRRRLRRTERLRVKWTTGKTPRNAKVAVIGVLYTLQRTPARMEGPLHWRLCATVESHPALFLWLLREANTREDGRTRTILLGDGSEHIWRLQQESFPQTVACIGWYHVIECMWSGTKRISQRVRRSCWRESDAKRGSCVQGRRALPSTSSGTDTGRSLRRVQDHGEARACRQGHVFRRPPLAPNLPKATTRRPRHRLRRGRGSRAEPERDAARRTRHALQPSALRDGPLPPLHPAGRPVERVHALAGPATSTATRCAADTSDSTHSQESGLSPWRQSLCKSLIIKNIGICTRFSVGNALRKDNGGGWPTSDHL